LASMKLPDGRLFKDVELVPAGQAGNQVNTAQ
jgi:hypothetical protein